MNFMKRETIVIFLILLNLLTHVIGDLQREVATGNENSNEKLLHISKSKEPENVQEISTITYNPTEQSANQKAHLFQHTQTNSGKEKLQDGTTITKTATTATAAATTTAATTITTKTTTITTAGTTTTTITTTTIPTLKEENLYSTPLPLLKNTEIKNVQDISVANKNFLDQSANSNYHPTAHAQYNSAEKKEKNDAVIITNRDESLYSKPLPLLNNVERKNIHEVTVVNNSTIEKLQGKKSHQSPAPQYQEPNNDDKATKEKLQGKKSHQSPAPQYQEPNNDDKATKEKLQGKKSHQSPAPQYQEPNNDDKATKEKLQGKKSHQSPAPQYQEPNNDDKATKEKPQGKKSHQSPAPQYQEPNNDDNATKEKVSTTESPHYESDEDYEVEPYDSSECVNCCNKGESPCTDCCDVTPYLSTFVLKSSGG
ncbi:activating signal cointegrator 1 complex subunit 2 homolog isoform X2 [Teleopsis dalmanni]|uniref:activating signal cointegrator 1 complex subunit 2 homolog isoform X2 n=1 Tax=Teleopsis dalmanni TaxID=139649 RepID=UPI0018CF95C9|nr:activating signal cointegrator 1 complex subunit 2 homolog isoform X2 [Teleopsis dalmanni]